MESELSIEETNKIRLSLGLKPLKAQSSTKLDETDHESPNTLTTEGRERIAVENWNKHQAEIVKAKTSKDRSARVIRARENAQRFRRLEGVGLGELEQEEEGDEDGDTSLWVKNMRKRQRLAAQKLSLDKEDEIQRAMTEQQYYTAYDLQGFVVGHSLEEFREVDGETVLTLKDATINENIVEGDELISMDLAARERLHENIGLKEKRLPISRLYGESIGEKQGILPQYDEEMAEKQKKRFVLKDINGDASKKTSNEKVAAEVERASKAPFELEPEAISDYVEHYNTKIRKVKKEKRSLRIRAVGGHLISSSPSALKIPSIMEIDNSTAPMKQKHFLEEPSLIDDEDLQASLSLQRRSALKKRKTIRPTEFALRVYEENCENSGGSLLQVVDSDDQAAGLVIDETSEFVASLRMPNLGVRWQARIATAQETKEGSLDVSNDIDVDMAAHEYPANVPAAANAYDISSTGLDAEATISRGVGATLAMLNQRGLIERDKQAEAKINLLRDREIFRAQKRMRELEAEAKAKEARAKDRQSGKFDRMSAREREEHARWENKQRDLQEARELQQRFKQYKPDVNLTYKDEFGRDMNQKEAFKYLSHQFHGKGSGKTKTEKRLKKIEDEKKREAASSLNSTATDIAVQSAAKKTKQAGVRLM